MTPVEFLNARLDEREALAKAAQQGPWEWDKDGNDGPNLYVVGRRYTDVVISSVGHGHTAVEITDADAEFIAANDPAYVLADIATKRAITAMAQQWIDADQGRPHQRMLRLAGEDVLTQMMQPFAGHPDFDPEWAA